MECRFELARVYRVRLFGAFSSMYTRAVHACVLNVVLERATKDASASADTLREGWRETMAPYSVMVATA